LTPQYPLRKDGVASRKVGDEWLLHDPGTGALHVINRTASFVWTSCDGSHTIEDIARLLADEFETPEGTDVTSDVAEIIQSFVDKGVLESQEV
jgi:hypothetical protein